MAAGYENAPLVMLMSVITIVATFAVGEASKNIELNIKSVLEGQWWRILSSQVAFRNTAQVVVGLVILYGCRHFERQMGLRKFGAFFLYTLVTSSFLLLALITVASSIEIEFIPSPGPYFLVYSMLAFFYGRIPKLHQSRYAFFGIAFSEKTWMYLLALQLLVSEGLDSIAAGFCGFLAGYLYDHDSIGLQKLRLPQAVQLVFTFLGDFFATILPLGGDNQSPAEALRQQQQQLPRGGGNAVRNRGFNLNDFAQFHPLDEVDEPQHRRFPPVEPPSEESITTLMTMGFDREAVVQALQATGNNVEAAANRLLR